MSRNIYRRAHRTGLVSADIFRPGVDNLTQLVALVPNDIWDGSLIHVRDTNNIYAYDLESTDAEDGANILTPSTGIGRWLKIGFGGTSAATSGTADKWVDVTKIVEDEVITVDKSSSPDWPQEVRREIIDVTEDGATLDMVEGYVVAGGGESLAETLGIGNLTAGSNIEMTAGDNLIMHNNAPPTTGAGQGSFFIGDGTGTTIAGQPYFREESDGAIHKLNNAAGGESLAGTLAIGNTTGGTNMSFTAGDNLFLPENAPPTTPAGFGSFFVGDGTGGTTQGKPYFREPSDGTVSQLDVTGGGGGEDLAATLAIGNTTGGTNLVVSTSDEIQGQTDLILRPGTNGNLDMIVDGTGNARLFTAAASPDVVFLQMGETHETGLGFARPGMFGTNGVLVLGPKDTASPVDVSSGSTTTNVRVFSSALRTNTSGAGVGSGDVSLKSGDTSYVSPGTAAGPTGECSLGTGNVTVGNATTGSARLHTGSTEGNSGDVTVESGVASGGNSVSGVVTVRSGAASAGTSGDVILETGTSSSDGTRGTVRVEAAGLEIKSANPAIAAHSGNHKKLVVSSTGTGYTSGGLYLVDGGGNSFLIDRALDVERINMPESPGNTVEFHGWVPRGCRLIEVKAMMTTLNTVGNLNLAVTSGGNSLLSGANFNLNGLSSANTVDNIALTGTSAHLLFAPDQVWKISIESTDVGMDGEGIYIQLTWEAGP